MNSQEWKHKVALLEEQEEKRGRNYESQNKMERIEELKSLIEATCECLPILLAAREEKSTVWEFLKILHVFTYDYPEWQAYQPIVDSLNTFVVDYEDWAKVEAYAETATTVADFELHTLTMKARAIVCKIEEKRVEIGVNPPRAPQTGGQFIVNDPCRYRSAFGLTQGVHFFETLVLIHPNWLASREVQAGWNTRRWINDKDYDLNAGERYRIDEENVLQCKYEPIDDHASLGFRDSFPFGTVLACRLDATQRTFTFYVNGQEVKFTKEFAVSSNPYYVLVCGDLLYLNFGQVPFKYPPTDLLACPTTELAKQLNKYALYESIEWMPLFDNRVEPYFSDEKQRKLKQTLDKLWKNGEITKESFEETYRQLFIEETFHRHTYNWRWLQAILENEYVHNESINDWATLVEIMVSICKDARTDYLNDFLVPYTKVRQPADSTINRTLAILFATLLKYKGLSRIYSRISLLSSFLLSAFFTTWDPATVMFTLIGLEVEKEALMQDLTSTEFTERLKKWKHLKFSFKFSHILPLLHLVIHHFEKSLLISPAPATPTDSSLSPSASSSQAKLSSDCLSFRSDAQWQSAYSHLSVDNSDSLAVPLFYFEVTLLTAGPMRIGWIAELGHVKSDNLGDTQLSIGYDGSTGCIWHDDFQWRVKNASKWKANDVIGCLLDLTLDKDPSTDTCPRVKERFIFYKNGEKIETNGDIYSRVRKMIFPDMNSKVVPVYEKTDYPKPPKTFISAHPYQAALSLGPYQQVNVNFGSTFFSYSPKDRNYWNFQKYSKHLLEQRQRKGTILNIKNSDNAFIAFESPFSIETMSMNKTGGAPTPSSGMLEESTICNLCQEETDRSLLQTVTHSFRFCQSCCIKNILCGKCKQKRMN